VTSLTEVPGEPTSAVTGPGGSLSDQLDGAHLAVVGLGGTGRPPGHPPRGARG